MEHRTFRENNIELKAYLSAVLYKSSYTYRTIHNLYTVNIV